MKDAGCSSNAARVSTLFGGDDLAIKRDRKLTDQHRPLEHWDGRGHPHGARGEEIPLLGRILCLAQTVEVFFTTHGRAAAYEMAAQRSGSWFDPTLVEALESFRHDLPF